MAELSEYHDEIVSANEWYIRASQAGEHEQSLLRECLKSSDVEVLVALRSRMAAYSAMATMHYARAQLLKEVDHASEP